MDSIAADIAARTAEGHAAFSMRGTDDRWILIQTNTFTNWANEQLKPLDVEVTQELHTEFTDGIKLCQLMEVLQVNKLLLALTLVLCLDNFISDVYVILGGGVLHKIMCLFTRDVTVPVSVKIEHCINVYRNNSTCHRTQFKL